MKNKEIEELLNKAKDIAKYGADGKQHTRMFNQFEAKALLSYIEQLEKNRDKAVEYIKNDLQISILPNNQIINGTEVVKRINKIINILKGESDE